LLGCVSGRSMGRNDGFDGCVKHSLLVDHHLANSVLVRFVKLVGIKGLNRKWEVLMDESCIPSIRSRKEFVAMVRAEDWGRNDGGDSFREKNCELTALNGVKRWIHSERPFCRAAAGNGKLPCWTTEDDRLREFIVVRLSTVGWHFF
jgi:hypothetical protein